MLINCRSYQIFLQDSSDYFEQFSFDQYSSVFVLVDENTKRDCYPMVIKSLPKHQLIEIASGEENKTIQTCELIWSALLKNGADRKSLLINLGGGVIGDMGGFCASTYMRGIDFIQVPTTLLAMVDASVGGKLAVDFSLVKNIIGLFKMPTEVIVDPKFLKTLSKRQIKSGFAEMLKHGLIKDKDYWKSLCSINVEDIDTTHIYRSVQLKNQIVEKDPKEMAERKILNFGHTIGHAIESVAMMEGKDILHGEAVMMGMFCEVHLSHLAGYLSYYSWENLIGQLNDIFPFQKHFFDNEKEIIKVVFKDKKNSFGKLKVVLLEEVGKAKYDVEVFEEDIISTLRFAKEYS